MCTSVAYLAIKILYLSIIKQTRLNDKILNEIKSGLAYGNDKQTRIQSAKCLYELAKYVSIESHQLTEIKEYLKDEVIDINVYCQAAYVIGLSRISRSTNQTIGDIHLDTLLEFFVFETLKLEDKDLTQEINNSILDIINKEINLNQVNKNVFSLLELILAKNEKYCHNVLKILVEYTNKPRHILPEECVIAVENLLNFEDFKNDSITILNNVIQNGQIVNNKTLKLS